MPAPSSPGQRNTSSIYSVPRTEGDDGAAESTEQDVSFDLQHIPTNSNPLRIASYYSTDGITDGVRKSSSQYFSPKEADLDSEEFWNSTVADAVYFEGKDTVLGDVVAAVFETAQTKKLNCLIIAKQGQTLQRSVNVSSHSRFYPAVKNLTKDLRKSRIRRCLAVSLLKTWAQMPYNIKSKLLQQAELPESFDWDETMAGKLASTMNLIRTRSPEDAGRYLLSLGYFRHNCQCADSFLVDTVYKDDPNDNQLVDDNNILASLLGDQLEHLFDPLMEYSPEPTEKCYKQPQMMPDEYVSPVGDDNVLVKSICSELVALQTNFTVSMVQFLQKFIVPLRMRVMEAPLGDYDTSKINEIFPPTLDEATRINCIFLDMLKLAQPYGSYEILKACGTTIPYFYKACMRHEAATKRFPELYDQFLAEMNRMGNSSLLTYDPKTTQNIMSSASLNLVKIQLILQRLMKTKDCSQCVPDIQDEMERYYKSCNDTILSFASDKLKPYNQRIFTPTGKILTELASSWPTQLQYGWLNRRVVSIFDVEDLLSNSIRNHAIMVVFSDSILLLTIDDDEYYCDLWKSEQGIESVPRPSVSDILMHSLVNEVPVTNMPKIKVSKWCSVADVTANYYNYGDTSCLRLLAGDVSGEYRIDKYSGKYVVDVICKAKILDKTQAFHLFRTETPKDDTTVYYTAHEEMSYAAEEVKSPFLILFNTPFNEDILKKKKLFGFITLNFATPKEIVMEGMTTTMAKFSQDIHIDDVTDTLSAQITACMADFMTMDDSSSLDALLKYNGNQVKELLQVLDMSDEADDAERDRTIELVEQQRREEQIHKEVRRVKTNNLDNLDTASTHSTKVTKTPPKWSLWTAMFKRSGKKRTKTEKAKKSKVSKRKMFRRKSTQEVVLAEPISAPAPATTPAAHEVPATAHDVSANPRIVEPEPVSAAPAAREDSEITVSTSLLGNPFAPSEPSTPLRSPQAKVTRTSPSLDLHSELSSSASVKVVPQHKTGESDPLPVTPRSPTPLRNPAKRNRSQSPIFDLPELPPATPQRQQMQPQSPEFQYQLQSPELCSAQLQPSPQMSQRSPQRSPRQQMYPSQQSPRQRTSLRQLAPGSPSQPQLSPRQPQLSPRQPQLSPQPQMSPQPRMSPESHTSPQHQLGSPIAPHRITEPNSKLPPNPTLGPSYYDQFRTARKKQEESIMELGIVAVPDKSVLNSGSLVYSPSMQERLSQLANTTHRPTGNNWVTYTSKDNLKQEGTDQFGRPTIPEEDETGESTNDSSLVFYDTLQEAPLDEEFEMDSKDSVESSTDAMKRSGTFSDVGMNTILNGSNPTMGKLDSGSKPETATKPVDSQAADATKVDDSMEQTSLCSALDTTEAGLLVKLADGEAILPDESGSTLCDLINDDSYNYLGQFLAGSASLTGDQIRIRKKDVDYDQIYSDQLRESSLKYLAGMIS